MSVVVFHLVQGHHIDLFLGGSPTWLTVILEHCHLGVAIFFVLSGFVIAHSLYGKDVTLSLAGRFMLRRSLRLDPPYWIAIVLTIGFGFMSAHFVAGKALPVVTAPQIVAHMFYLQGILGYPYISDVFWTLCLELQFYLVYVFLLLGGGKHPGVMLVTAGIISVAWPIGLLSGDVWQALFLPLWHCFLVGSVVYWAWRKPSLMPFCGLFIAVIAASAAYHGNWFSLVCAATALILLLSVITNQIFSMMRWRLLQVLGAVSYSLYLSHNFVTGASFRVGYLLTGETIATEIMWSVITIAVCVAVAYAIWRWVELSSIALSHLVKLDNRPDRSVLVKEARA